jgi:uncharacterized membrane protein
VSASPTLTPVPVEADADDGMGTGLIMGIIIAGAVVIVGVVLYFVRRRGAPTA